MNSLGHRLTYANVMSTIAVFVALGGTSIAAVGSVRTGDIRDGTITHVDVRDGTLRGADVATNTIGTRNLVDNGITADDIGIDSVTARAVQDGAIGSAKVADGSITTNDLADESITANDIRNGSITAEDIADGVIPLAPNLSIDGPPDVPSLRTLGTRPEQAAAGDDPRLTDARPPSGSAGGALTGTFPNPGIAAGAVDATSLFSASLLDGAAGSTTLRSLGTGANQAAAGNDPRLSDARTPTGSAGGDLTGTYPTPTLAGDSVTGAEVVDRSLGLTDVAQTVSSLSLPAAPTPVPANDCVLFQGNVGSEIEVDDYLFMALPNDTLSMLVMPPTRFRGNPTNFPLCNLSSSTVNVPGGTRIGIFALR